MHIPPNAWEKIASNRKCQVETQLFNKCSQLERSVPGGAYEWHLSDMDTTCMRDCLPCVAEMFHIGAVWIITAVVCLCDGINLDKFVWVGIACSQSGSAMEP